MFDGVDKRDFLVNNEISVVGCAAGSEITVKSRSIPPTQ